MAEVKRKPAIRFAGFADDWEQRKLSDVTESYSGGTPSVGKKEYYTGQIPFIRSAEINSDTTELLLSESGLTNSSAKMVYTGDILYALYGATSGEVGIAQIQGAINQAILAIIPDDGYDSQFLMQWLRGQKQRIIDKYLQGGQGNLSGALVKDLLVNFPNHDEQQRIGNYFSILDNLITLHQRKYEKLLNLKKAMLEKMFPKIGAVVPEVRFAGFTDPWEQRKLGEATEELTAYATMQSNFPLLTSARSGLMLQNEYRNNASTENQNTLFSVVPMGSCTYRHMSDDDIFHFNVNEIVENGLVSREYPVFVASTCNNLWAIVNYINSSPRFRAFCREQKIGGTRTRLYYKNLSAFSMMLPSSVEQESIGHFFRCLDHLITLHQRKLEKLRNLKKAFLEAMFV